MTTATLPDTLAGRLEAVRNRIATACQRAGRDPAVVSLIAVSKTHPAASVRQAMAAGLTDFGENRVQEAVAKMDELAAMGPLPNFHLIGHLQTNKVRAAAGRFDLIHSVDSERLLRAVSATGVATRVLLEVNVSGEPTKFGVAPAGVAQLAELARALPNVHLEGLMTVAPETANPADARPVFAALRRLAEAHGLRALSMGMTNDFEVAIEEGATYIRIGRAIFGERTG